MLTEIRRAKREFEKEIAKDLKAIIEMKWIV